MTGPSRCFDVAVIGAGPSGAFSALLAARSGLSTILIEKKPFPRAKVCGCCLSGQALALLEQHGLSSLVDSLNAAPFTRLHLKARSLQLVLPVPTGRSVSRALFDQALVDEAVGAGVEFLDNSHCIVDSLSDQSVELTAISPEQVSPISITAKVVVAADGLGGTALSKMRSFDPLITPGSRVGIGAISCRAPAEYQPGGIYMCYSRFGYLGMVQLEDGRTDIAAAIDQKALREQRSAANAARAMLTACGSAVPADLDTLTWSGTVPLTRRRAAVAGKRLFVVGDAASYVEPFTGEGIAWALQSAAYCAPLVVQACRRWAPLLAWQWERTYRATIARRQRTTRLLAELLKHPQLALPMAALLQGLPDLSAPLVAAVCGRPLKEIS